MTKLAKRVERGFIKGNEIVRDKKIWDTHLQRSPTVLIIRSSVEGPVQQAVGDVLLVCDCLGSSATKYYGGSQFIAHTNSTYTMSTKICVLSIHGI